MYLKIQFGLMGGLGNQLFQMSAALKVAHEYKQTVTLNPNFGHVRINAQGDPEILSFKLPINLLVARRGFQSSWIPKLFGHARKITISPIGFERFTAYKFLINVFSQLQVFFLIGPGGRIQLIEEVGFHEIEKISESTIFLGYFQSYRYSMDKTIRESLMSLSTSEFIEIQNVYRKIRSESNPLIVHVRLGDYLNEESFGILSKDYYGEAIESEFQTGLYDSIWLFSDDFRLAIEMIPERFQSIVRNVSEAQESSAATLEIMRLGKGFVIGNSTFSWWGATLAHTEMARVAAPSPWFRGMGEPRELIPPHWRRIQV